MKIPSLESIVKTVKQVASGAVLASAMYLASPSTSDAQVVITSTTLSNEAAVGVGYDSTTQKVYVVDGNATRQYNFVTGASPALQDAAVAISNLSGSVVAANMGLNNKISLNLGGGSGWTDMNIPSGSSNSVNNYLGANQISQMGVEIIAGGDHVAPAYNSFNGNVGNYDKSTGSFAPSFLLSNTGLTNLAGVNFANSSANTYLIATSSGQFGLFDASGNAIAGNTFTNYTGLGTVTGFSFDYNTGIGFVTTTDGIDTNLTGLQFNLNFTPVPEPATYGLLAGGLVLALAANKRRKFKQAQKDALETKLGSDGSYEVTSSKPYVD